MGSRKIAVTKGCVIAGLFVLMSGCHTLITRTDDSAPTFYPATKSVVGLATDPWCWAFFFACPIMLVSFPVEVVLDTALLPVDAVNVARYHKRQALEEAAKQPQKVSEVAH